MKFIFTIFGSVLIAASVWIATPLRLQAEDSGDKVPLVISGYITKIDLKKKELTVHGTEVDPGSQTQKFAMAAGLQGRGGGGRGGGGRGGGSRGGGGGTPEAPPRDFSINVRPDTAIQNEKSTLTVDDLRVQDYVVVLGFPKGKGINAISISVSNR